MPVQLSSPIGTTWRVTQFDDPTGVVGPHPVGEGVLTFRDASASDRQGNSASLRIDGDQIHFGRWVNDLAGRYGGAPQPAPLTLDEQRFLFTVLDGDTTWRLADGELVIEKPSVGAVAFAAVGSDE